MRNAAFAIFLATICWPAARPTLSPDDFWAWHEVRSPRINPDGTDAVWVESWKDRATDRVCSNLWQTTIESPNPRRVTEGPWRDWSPVWSEDSRLAWISDRSGTPQVWVRGSTGAEQLTNGPDAVETIAWGPGGKSLAFTSRGKLFTVAREGGKPRTYPLGDLVLKGEPAWMPDGQSILVSAAPPPDTKTVLEGGEIYAIRVSDGTRRQITHHPGPDESPVPSPDGSRIAWLAREPKPQSYTVTKLYVANPDGSRAKMLAGSLDRDVAHPQWSSDSRTVYFIAADHGTSHVYAARNDGSVRQVTTGAERLAGFSVADTGRAVTVRAPAEVVTFTVDLPPKPVVLAAPNRALLDQRDIGATEELQFESAGKAMQAWYVKPPAFDAAKKYPLLLDFDDAPRRMCGAEFRFRAQWFAARGMVVLCVNPRGTPGYGEEFGNLIRSRYPGDDFDDLMRAVDAMVAKGFIDPQRLSMKAGLLAAWALGHTDRFHRITAVDPISDWATEVATATEGLYKAATLMGGMPWDDPDQYTKHSPLYFGANFKTPTLIAGSGPGAAELAFALRAKGVEYRATPTPSRPSGEIALWQEIAAWVSK